MGDPSVQRQRKRAVDILCVLNVLGIRHGLFWYVDTVFIFEEVYNIANGATK